MSNWDSLQLGRGMVAFLRATLGFEQDIMKEAGDRLVIAEAAASDARRRAHRDGYSSHIYPAGSEYALLDAEVQLMTAVLAVLNESVLESAKGFYRLRKAYATLQEIFDAEKKYLNDKTSSRPDNSRPSTAQSISSFPSSNKGSAPTSAAQSRPTSSLIPPGAGPMKPETEDDDLEFVDADEKLEKTAPTETYEGHVDTNRLSAMFSGLKTGRPGISRQASRQSMAPSVAPSENYAEEELNVAHMFSNPVDIFVHSGTNLCFGLLQLVLSLVPPTFSKLLSIVGFRGDRDLGVSMLWRATAYDNINGSMAGLITLGHYNGMVGFCDILTSNAYPKDRCRALLAKMRSRYPDSRLWLLEEARMLASDRNLPAAVKLLSDPKPSALKQVEALRLFEKSLNNMYMHHYEACAEGFIKCVDMNNWSHALYLYIAGSCYVELYRLAKTSSSETERAKAPKYASRATEVLNQVQGKTKKKGLMGRQLPFDAFVVRKINKWTARANDIGAPLVDGVGVCPVEELVYFWNGFVRMGSNDLEYSLRRLEDYSSTSGWETEAEDEKGILHVLSATITARLGLTPEARNIITSHVLNIDPLAFKGTNKDNWIVPVAHYEMAVCCWEEAGGEKGVGKQDNKLTECASWIDKVVKAESFDLDARVGLKVRTAQSTLKKIGVIAG